MSVSIKLPGKFDRVELTGREIFDAMKSLKVYKID